MSPDFIRKEDLSKTNRLSLKSNSEQMGMGKTSTVCIDSNCQYQKKERHVLNRDREAMEQSRQYILSFLSNIFESRMSMLICSVKNV